MTRTGENQPKASQLMNLLSTKAAVRIGLWNVRTMYEPGKTAQVANEMRRYNIQILGISEFRRNGMGSSTLESVKTVLFSGRDADHDHTEGVAIMLAPGAHGALMDWSPVSHRIMIARFHSKARDVSVIQCYAPTNNAEYRNRESFNDQLQSTIVALPKQDIKILMGDMNAKIGGDNRGKELVMGPHALGVMNENGELFSSLCFQ